LTPDVPISFEQARFLSYEREDDGLGGRSVVGIDIQGISAPCIPISARTSAGTRGSPSAGLAPAGALETARQDDRASALAGGYNGFKPTQMQLARAVALALRIAAADAAGLCVREGIGRESPLRVITYS